MTNPKIAVCTTFPVEHYNICAEEMLHSFKQYWPEDIVMYIQLDEMPAEQFNDLNNKIVEILGVGRCYIAGKFDEDQLKFIERWKDHKPKSYLDDVVKFSHKVFALEKCADAIKNDVDRLIWMDADVITKKPVTHEWLKGVLPEDDEVISYLCRLPLHSECGFVGYNLRNGGYELLCKMKNEYILGSFADYEKGATDCHVLDLCVQGMKTKNLCPTYKYGVDDIHVWKDTVLAEKMAHRKGNRKHIAAENRNNKGNHPVEQAKMGGVLDANDMKVKTRNCLDHAKIKANVAANITQIRAWATLCKPSDGGEVVMCAAGPSLVNHIDEIKALQAKGAKVVAVKHAIDTLTAHGVEPWAVVLLDPRAHVEGFVKNPSTKPIYFVASMCDPSVVKSLNDHKCTVIGYHAFVNAGETDLMLHSDLPVSGGSATSTRTIGLFGDMFGFKKFHCYGYDLSHQAKVDFNEKTSDGQPKYLELSIGTNTHKGKYITRNFITEGQFLAQSNELQHLYKERPDIELIIYGDGMAAWLYRHHKLHSAFRKEYNENLERKRSNTPTIDQFVEAISSGSKLSRGE